MQCWNVYIGRTLIDSVYFSDDCNRDYVRNSLIDHDGYDARIRVAKMPHQNSQK